LTVLASAALGRDCRTGARTAADLGLAGLDPAAIGAYVEAGWEETTESA
jgi:hypothetical protein